MFHNAVVVLIIKFSYAFKSEYLNKRSIKPQKIDNTFLIIGMGAVCNAQKKYKSSKEVPINAKELQLILTSLNRNFSEKLINYDMAIKKLKEKLKTLLQNESAAKKQFNLSLISNLIVHQKIQAKITRGHDSSQHLLSECLDTIKESEEDFSAVQGLAIHIEGIMYAVDLLTCLKKKPFDKLQKKLEIIISNFYGESKYKELTLFENLRDNVRPEDVPKYEPTDQEINEFLVAFGNENNINSEVLNQFTLKAGINSQGSPVEERKIDHGNFIELENGKDDKVSRDLKIHFMAANPDQAGNIGEKGADQQGENHIGVDGSNFQRQIVEGDSPEAEAQNREGDALEYADLEGQLEEEKKPSRDLNQKLKQSKINIMPQTNGRLNNSITALNTMDKRLNNQKHEPNTATRDMPRGFKVLSESFDEDPQAVDQDDSGNYLSEADLNKHQTEKTPELVINGLKSSKKEVAYPMLRIRSTTQEKLQGLLQGFSSTHNNDPTCISNKKSFASNEENLFALCESSQMKIEGNDVSSPSTNRKRGISLKDSFKENGKREDKEKKEQPSQAENHYRSSEIMAKFEKLRSDCSNSGQNFTDLEFSIEKQRTLAHSPQTFPMFGKEEWKRLWDSFQKESLLPECIEVASFRDAAVISLNFLLALNLLTFKPELLSTLIYPSELTKEGIYCISLCDAGKWSSLLIDDYVPFAKGTGELAFSKSKENQLWISVLEKALSKLLGSYQALSLAREETIIRSLTGASCQMLEIGPEALPELSWLYHSLSKLFQDGYILYAKKFKGESYSEANLVKCSIITDIKILEGAESDFNMEIQLADVFEQKDPEKKDDYQILESKPSEASSWKSLQDFHAEFNRLVVFRMLHNSYYNSVDLNYGLLDSLADEYPNVSLVQITASAPTQATLSVVQKPYEYFASHGKPKYRYSFVRMTVGKLDPYGRVYDQVQGNFDAVYDLSLEYAFDEGTYLVMIEFFWNNEETKNAVFSVNSTQSVALEKVKCSQLKYSEVIEQLCSVYAHRELSLDQLPDDKILTTVYSPTFKRRISTKLKGFLLVLYKNESDEETAQGHLVLYNKEKKGFLQCVPTLEEPSLPKYDKKFSVLPQRNYLFVFKLQDLDPVPIDERQPF